MNYIFFTNSVFYYNLHMHYAFDLYEFGVDDHFDI